MRGSALPLVAALLACACTKDKEQPRPRAARDAAPRPPDASAPDDAAAAALPPHRDVPDLATAVRELVGPDVRVLGVGELHQRVDGATAARSALARFTDEVLPVLADRTSDLVLETWLPDRRCGGEAETATAKVEAQMQRPATTKSELATLVDRARAAHVRPHAMRLGCDDWKTIAPPGQEVDYGAMLGVITRELGRIAAEAAAHSPDRLVITYGGALHNDVYPDSGLEDWSFAARVDQATGGHYLELDLYVPEYAAADKLSQGQPWFPLLRAAGPDHVVVVERGPRSYLVILPTTPASQP